MSIDDVAQAKRTEQQIRAIVRDELARRHLDEVPDMKPHFAAYKALVDWIDADDDRALVGCTPSMVAQIAIDAFVVAGGVR